MLNFFAKISTHKYYKITISRNHALSLFIRCFMEFMCLDDFEIKRFCTRSRSTTRSSMIFCARNLRLVNFFCRDHKAQTLWNHNIQKSCIIHHKSGVFINLCVILDDFDTECFCTSTRCSAKISNNFECKKSETC